MNKSLIIFVFIIFFSCSKNDNNNIDFNFENYIENFDSNQIIPDSTLDQLDGQQLRILRNLIFAKHGYSFRSGDLHDYFSQFSWYYGVKTNVDNELTEIDLINIQKIISYENNLESQEIILVNNDNIFDHTQYSNTFSDLDAINEYLNTANGTRENPVVLKLDISLGTMADTESNLRRFLKIIDDIGKYVALDLSSCRIAGIDFNPIPTVQTGKWFIVSLILPDSTINIPNGSVRESTFNYFYNLRTLIARGVTGIGLYAFDDCIDLNVNFHVMSNIVENTFSGNTSLVSADFPNVVEIGKNAFADNINLINLNFPKVTTIGEGAFQNCVSLSNISFPEITIINRNAFAGCAGLLTVNFPKALYIGIQSFKGCTSLINIYFPKVTIINDGAFEDCISLTSVYFPLVTTIEGSTYRPTISGGLWGNGGAFQNCINLINVNFPLVTKIGDSTFQNSNLTNIYFPVTTHIGENAFQDCRSLTNIIFPSAMYVGMRAFANCTALVSAYFPEVRVFMSYNDHRFNSSTVFQNNPNFISITIGEHYSISLTAELPGDLTSNYRTSGAGTYTRSPGSNSWTKQ